MKKAILVLTVLFAISLAKTTRWHQLDNYKFKDYEIEFRKNYESNSEREFREQIFSQKLQQIKQHNKDETKTWKEGVNQFTDRTEEEISQHLGLNKQLLYSTKRAGEPVGKINVADLPPHVDWRDKEIISDVKDQGQCGSCWTFGTAETIESYWALQTGELQDLSEQNILDCVPNADDCGGTGGCGGGTPELAYTKIQQLGGLATEWQYPYVSYWGQNQTCQLDVNPNIKPAASLTNFTVLPSNEYDPVMKHLAEVGPLAVNVDASSWSSYETGVYDGCNQTHPDIDHVVQLVGYGTDNKYGDYWIVRNSWSTTFGEDGYIRLKRSHKAECGTDLNPSDGTGCNNGPSEVTVCGICGILYDTSFPTVTASQ